MVVLSACQPPLSGISRGNTNRRQAVDAERAKRGNCHASKEVACWTSFGHIFLFLSCVSTFSSSPAISVSSSRVVFFASRNGKAGAHPPHDTVGILQHCSHTSENAESSTMPSCSKAIPHRSAFSSHAHVWREKASHCRAVCAACHRRHHDTQRGGGGGAAMAILVPFSMVVPSTGEGNNDDEATRVDLSKTAGERRRTHNASHITGTVA